MLGHSTTFKTQDALLGFDNGCDDAFMSSFLDGIINANPGDDPLPYHDAELLSDVLNYGFDEFVGFHRVTSQSHNAGTSQDQNRLANSHSGTEIPAIRTEDQAAEKAFRESIWLWNPLLGDSSVSEQIHLASPRDHVTTYHYLQEVDASLYLSTMARDRLLSLKDYFSHYI